MVTTAARRKANATPALGEATVLFETPLPLLNLGHLRGLSAVDVITTSNSAVSAAAVHLVVRLANRKPFIQTFWSEEQRKCGPELAAHRTVEYEVYG